MLRAVIVIDYQNMHLTGHNFFEHDGTPRHHSLVHPLYYARQLLEARNSSFRLLSGVGRVIGKRSECLRQEPHVDWMAGVA